MASEYLKWKYRDLQPERPAELTARQKRANWWHYNKWRVLTGAALLALGLYLAARAMGLGQLQPDYQIAYVGSAALPADTVSALESALAGLGGDANGDGRAVVRLNQYVLGEGAGEDAIYGYAANTRLLADLDACDSYFFLLEDPAAFQESHQILRRLDGSLPEGADRSHEGCCLAWSDCPALRELPLGEYSERVLGQTIAGNSQELLAGLFLARRGFWTERTARCPEACDALWDRIAREE